MADNLMYIPAPVMIYKVTDSVDTIMVETFGHSTEWTNQTKLNKSCCEFILNDYFS